MKTQAGQIVAVFLTIKAVRASSL